MHNFSTKNPEYNYSSLSGSGCFDADGYAIIFACSASVQLFTDGVQFAEVPVGSFINTNLEPSMSYVVGETGLVLCLSTTKQKDPSNQRMIRNLEQDSYKVHKPWGRELWLTGETAKFSLVLKYIEVSAGTRTSLQVHQYKHESNLIYQGTAIYRYSDEQYQGKNIDYPLSEIKISTPTLLNINPLDIHQVEAITDLILIEASTGYLDDVIRICDDSGRADGRIHSEHITL